ncbi:uncharacterized protein LOC143218929 [Lasioglossum baleicum]|uniref:uncharacterized protein LOC143218929 n=1 Tax=Lasioglossum baleicum TaxID=434251 RepID=UPI003FCD89CB
MNDTEPLSQELQTLVDEFARIRDAYIVLKAYCNVQEEIWATEKLHSSRMKENFEKLSETYSLLGKRYTSMIEESKQEKESLQKTIEHLKEECDHLRLLSVGVNGDNGQVSKLENEVALLKTELIVQTAKHNEDIAILKQKHSDELRKYRMFQNSKLNAASSGVKKKAKPRNPAEENDMNFFRWPELTIEKISSAPINAEEDTTTVNNVNKKRKLFCNDNDDAVSIFQME